MFASLWALGILGCATPSAPVESVVPTRPSAVPSDALSLYLAPGGIHLGKTAVGDRDTLEANLTNGQYEPLLEALPEGDAPVWIDAPGPTPWMTVRRMVISSADAGHPDRWLSSGGDAYPMQGRSPSRYRPTCGKTPPIVQGVARRMSLNLHAGTDGVWAQADVRFHPRVGGVAHIGVPDQCWASDCSVLGPHQSQCEAAADAPNRVAIGGPTGCLLPIRKQVGDEAKWSSELATALRDLGWTDRDEVSLQIEANVPWSAAVAILGGFEEAGLPQPYIGLPLVEGHEGPPPCNATVTTADALQLAGAAWFGSHQSSAAEQGSHVDTQ